MESHLKSLASFEVRKKILQMFHGFLAIRKTVAELTCKRLAKFWNILRADPACLCTSVVLSFYSALRVL